MSDFRGTIDPRVKKLSSRVESELRALFGGKLRKVILFGPCCKENFQTSDVDIMVLVDEPQPETAHKKKITDMIMALSAEYDMLLSLFLENEKEYEEAKHYEPLLERVAREGIAIYAA